MDPVSQCDRARLAQEFAIDLQQVSPLVRPVFHVCSTANKRIDQLFPFRLGITRICKEVADLVGVRRQSGESKVEASNKLVIRAEFTRKHFHTLEFVVDLVVDVVVADNVLPGESTAVAHHGQGGRCIGALVANQNRCFTSP